MRQALARQAERAHAALVVLLSCLLVAMPLSGAGSTGSELAAASLVVLVLASAVARAPRVVIPLGRLGTARPVAGVAGPPVLRTRQTDPTHQPLAPRAPGRV